MIVQVAAALSMTYLHRYEQLYETKEAELNLENKILCVAVIFLGCKTTENLRSIRDVFNVVFRTADEHITVMELDKVSLFIYSIRRCDVQ